MDWLTLPYSHAANICIHFPLTLHFCPPHSPNYIPQFLWFLYLRKMERKPKETDWEANRVRQRLCMVSPCSAVKHIEVWLDCTGQFLWQRCASCQTHRCRVMTHCVLESCQKPGSVLLPCSPYLSPPFFAFIFLSIALSPWIGSNSVYNLTRHEFRFNNCRPCICFFSFEVMFSWGLDFHLWTYRIKSSLINSDYTKQKQRAKILKVTDRARKVSACISWENAEQYGSG